MPDFVELWTYLSATPLFGLTTTLVVYVLASAAYGWAGQAPWANPVLWSVLVIAAGLSLADVPYPSYFAGAQFIHFLLGPAVVALACPLWERREYILHRLWKFLAAALLGAFAAIAAAAVLGVLLGLPREVTLSLLPKSVTAPVAMGVAEKIGGEPALAAVFAVITGLIGAMSGKYVFQALRVPISPTGWTIRGFSLGTVSHGIGAARAMQVHADAGAYAGAALGLQVVLQSLLLPLVVQLIL